MEAVIGFLEENYYWLILGTMILIGYGVQKWNFNQLSQGVNKFEGNYSVVFSPVDSIEAGGPIDHKFGFGLRISYISGKIVMPILKLIVLFGIIYLALEYMPEGRIGNKEKIIAIAIIGIYGTYTLYRMTKKIALHEGGLILQSFFGKSGYSYEDIEEIEFTESTHRPPGNVWFVWKTPVVVLHFHRGERIELSSSVYSNLQKKMKILDQNLVVLEE